nr:FHA domain-containing protein [uncultured Glaciecola sp.]
MNKVVSFLVMLITLFSTQVNANELQVIAPQDIASRAITDELRPLSELSKQRVATQMAGTKKRYTYKLTLVNFTPKEVDIFSGMALAKADDVHSRLLDEKTKFHFLNLFLSSKTITFELSTLVSPSQFREQMSRLFERMNIEVSSQFIQKDNLFKNTRVVSAYSIQLIILWSAVVILVMLLTLLAFWSWIQFKLNLYESSNQSAKWVRLVSILKLIPVQFLCRDKWLQQLPYWEKRVSQADIWFDNAQQLLQNHEIDSAHVFVKKSLEDNASNISAQALEISIAKQLSEYQVIQNQREQFKNRVSKSIELAKAGKLFAALEQAYIALELCHRRASFNLPVIDLQIESTKNLIKRITGPKTIRCAGITLASEEQIIHINCGESMRIGRGDPKANNAISLDLTLPQETLSRVHKSIVIARQPNGFTAQDLGSTNGMWLQYKACETNQEFILAEMDQIHHSPPDEIGSIGFQVKHLESNQSIALRLCQNSILPGVNLSSSKSFINFSEYANHCWYLSNERFYLLFSLGRYIWYSESQWRDTKAQQQTQEHFTEVLKIELKDEVWLHLSSRSYDVKIDNTQILGPVPLPLKSELSVNGFIIDVMLIAAKVEGNAMTDKLYV